MQSGNESKDPLKSGPAKAGPAGLAIHLCPRPFLAPVYDCLQYKYQRFLQYCNSVKIVYPHSPHERLGIMDVVFLSLTKLDLPLLNRSPPNLPVNLVVSDDGLNHTGISIALPQLKQCNAKLKGGAHKHCVNVSSIH